MGVKGLLPEGFLACMKPEDRKALGKAGMTRQEAIQKQTRGIELTHQARLRDFANRHRGEIVLVMSRTDKRTTTPKGTPDCLWLARGKVLALEIKAPGKKPSEDQRARADEYLRAGVPIFVSERYEDSTRLIHEHFGIGSANPYPHLPDDPHAGRPDQVCIP